MRRTLLIAIALAPAACGAPHGAHSNLPPSTPSWQSLNSGVDVSLRGLSAIDSDTAWASGQNGTVLRTIDSGVTWEFTGVAGAETLDFRDVHAFDSENAVVLSAGEPARIYRTSDGGASWQEVYANDAPGVFFDAMDFWDDGRGLAFSDPVDGRLLILRTRDRGETWEPIDPAGIPLALEGEAGFAASGTCLAVAGERDAFVGLGGPAARVFVSRDGGARWDAVATPVAHSESSGIFSLAMRPDGVGVAVGGDYTQPEATINNAAYTSNGGNTWRLSESMPGGYRSAVVKVGRAFVATGPNGTDLSTDGGRTWRRFAEGPGYHAIAFTQDGCLWAVGSEGRIGRIILPSQ